MGKSPSTDFETWLYWLLVSIVKHSNCPIADEKLEGLSRKGKIVARQDMRDFDALHRVLITASERVEKGKNLSGKDKITHAHLFCRLKGRIYIKFGSVRKRRKYFRQDSHLNIVGYF